jgi:peptidyl-prolyl cis-trans isomerase SurA
MNYYETHKKEIEHPESVELAEIMVTIKAAQPDKPTDAEIAAAQARAGELLDALKKGANFEETAKKSSEGPSAAQGGVLGTFNRGMLAKEIEAKVFAQQPGGFTDVIRTRQGFIILKTIQHTPAGVPPVKDVEPQIQEAIYVERLQPALRAYLTRLREEAFIDIVPGYVDTGASPNQTKLTYTSTAEEEKKKKKKKKHFLLF